MCQGMYHVMFSGKINCVKRISQLWNMCGGWYDQFKSNSSSDKDSLVEGLKNKFLMNRWLVV